MSLAGQNGKRILQIMGPGYLTVGAINAVQLKDKKLKKKIGTVATITNVALGGYLLYRGYLKKD